MSGRVLLCIYNIFIFLTLRCVAKLVTAEPYSTVEHVGEKIAETAKANLAAVGVGAYIPKERIDTVAEEVHGSCIDQGSNMLAGFKDFEGGPCACHRLSNCLKKAFESPGVASLVMKVKGIAAHFHRSTKGSMKLQEIQEACGLPTTKPPTCSVVRWSGVVPMLSWTAEQRAALKRYTVECPPNCALNDDGTGFKDHLLSEEDYAVIPQLVSTSPVFFINLIIILTNCF